MRFLHTADLHLGQILYQDYTREDEHEHYFSQLREWCGQFSPDALLVCGDIYDIQQPSAATMRRFNQHFALLHRLYPQMAIIIIGGNHDSPSRLQAASVVWELAGVTLIGTPPPSDCLDQPPGWQDHYVVRLPQGYVVALPYYVGSRRDMVQALLDYVDAENHDNKPVVMMSHTAVAGMDATGHSTDIGNLSTLDHNDLGQGYDYLALGHIHRPQTIGHADEHNTESIYPSGVMRYSGSALHVSADERYPHSVSLVDIDKHGGTIHLQRLPINQLRHFYELPSQGSASSIEEVMSSVAEFALEKGSGYFRLCIDYGVELPSDFNQRIYKLIEPYNGEVRFNPKIVWTNTPDVNNRPQQATFQVADLQQMTNPLDFIRQTIDQYPGLDIDTLTSAFAEVEKEIL